MNTLENAKLNQFTKCQVFLTRLTAHYYTVSQYEEVSHQKEILE